MPDIKPHIEDEQVLTLLQEHFSAPISQLTVIAGGQIAQTFSFRVEEQDYIIRFNHDNMGGISYAKEAYLYRRIGSSSIPFPAILYVGRFRGLQFAISQKVPGTHLNLLPWEEYQRVIPDVMATLHAIHQVDVSDTVKYGVFDDNGVGMSPGWRTHLSTIYDEEDESDFYGKWHTLFNEGLLERNVFVALYKRMLSLLDYCPEDRYLMHGDYGFDNVLVHDGKITAVLDWLDARYGDFIFDVAWLDFWSPESHYAQRFQQFYADRNIPVPAYGERLRCYECFIGMVALRFFASVGKSDPYQWARRSILSLQLL